MILLFLAVGVAAGILSGLFGIGGGVLIVPALVLFARIDWTKWLNGKKKG